MKVVFMHPVSRKILQEVDTEAHVHGIRNPFRPLVKVRLDNGAEFELMEIREDSVEDAKGLHIMGGNSRAPMTNQFHIALDGPESITLVPIPEDDDHGEEG